MYPTTSTLHFPDLDQYSYHPSHPYCCLVQRISTLYLYDSIVCPSVWMNYPICSASPNSYFVLLWYCRNHKALVACSNINAVSNSQLPCYFWHCSSGESRKIPVTFHFFRVVAVEDHCSRDDLRKIKRYFFHQWLQLFLDFFKVCCNRRSF